MKKVLIVASILPLFIVNPLNSEDNPKQKKQPVKIDKLQKQGKKDKYKDAIDTTKYKKVKLIDVVLETVSRSDVLKSAREKVIQYEIKVRNAISEHYPTLDFEYNFGRTQLSPSGDEDKEYKYFNDRNYRFVLRQNLYSGGSIDKNVKSVIKKFEVSQNKYNIQLQKEIKKAIKAYFDVVFAKRTVMVNERNMKKLQKILDIVTVKYDNGAASIGDLTSIKASFANAMTKLVKVKSKLIESLRYYEYIVGERFKKTIPYEKYFDINVTDFDKLYKRALENNKDLINYYKTIEAEKYNIKRAEAAFKPTVDLQVSYKKVLNKEDMLEHEDRVNGKVKLKYNLYNAGRDENKILEVSSTIRDLNYKLEEEKKKVKWNLSKLYTAVDSVSQALESTKNEIIASRKMVSSYWDEFKLGEQDLPSLLQGQRQLNTAEKELVKFEKEYITSLFNILQLTGSLTNFFDIDPASQKYLDFSKSDYTGDLTPNKGLDLKTLDKENEEEKEPTLKDDILDKEDKLDESELDGIDEIENIQEPQLKLLDKKISLDEAIDSYTKQFLNFDENTYMIKVGTFKNIFESFKFIRELKIEENSLVFDVIDDYEIKTVVVHNNFKTKKEAQEYLERMQKAFDSKEYEVASVKDLRTQYYKYISGLKVEKPKTKVEVKVEKVVVDRYLKPVEEKVFETNEAFKTKFLNAKENDFTINISTFTKLDDVENVINQNDIYEESLFFKYGENGSLYKLVYGLFDDYNEAKNYIKYKGIKGDNIFPVVEDIKSIQELYNENIDLNKKKKKEVKYEYVDSNEKVQQIVEEPIKKEEKPKQKTKIVEESLEENEELYPLANKELINKYLESPKDYYSLHIASLPTMEKGVEYIDRNYLENDTVVVQTTAGQAMIMYGIYDSYSKVKEVLEQLPESIKKNKPIIRKIGKTQELFKKNNLKLGK